MFFNHIQEAPPDPVFGLLAAALADPRPMKVNLTIGIYQDEQARSELLLSVRKAKEQVDPKDLMADYLPIDGARELVELLGPLVFGKQEWEANSSRIYGAHTVGGTGALRVGSEFLIYAAGKRAYLPNYTWVNHHSVLERAGCKIETYSYYSHLKKNFDLNALIPFLERVPEKSVVLLHACCHNPTGCDPTMQDWKEISLVMKEKKLIPFFDFAYQGLGTGWEKDSEAVRLFLQDGHEMLVAYSCAKNFSLYRHRVGVLFAVCEDAMTKVRVGSQIKKIIRALYSNPPAAGAHIVTQTLRQEDLYRLWQKDLEEVRHRINEMRESFVAKLMAKSKEIDFSYLQRHKGMFSFVDLDKSQIQQLVEKFGIYLLDNGRMNVAGLTSKNIDYVVNGILAVCGAR